MSEGIEKIKTVDSNKNEKVDELESMSKDELIDKVIKARIEVERAKKAMQSKEVVRKKNSSIYPI